MTEKNRDFLELAGVSPVLHYSWQMRNIFSSIPFARLRRGWRREYLEMSPFDRNGLVPRAIKSLQPVSYMIPLALRLEPDFLLLSASSTSSQPSCLEFTDLRPMSIG